MPSTGATEDIDVLRLGLGVLGDEETRRAVPVEAPIAIDIGGIGYAVMMATPVDLKDYITGFALSEGLITRADELTGLVISEVEGGFVARLTLPTEGMQKALARARKRVGESSCGLCGIDNIAEVLRPLPKLTARINTTRAAIASALATLPEHQPLSRLTGAVHAAAFCLPDGTIALVREDVGRHNALDKLLGAMARAKIDPASGFILLSARCSYELVEKTVRAGCPMLVTISAPTSLAVQRATNAGLTLVTLARPDAALVANGRDTIKD
ncbi:formate dehydrogenase accessory sulfurtransferase FdhD [Devosia sp. 63-57]|uniref:formate dehydrogenase accessory sulfurtransferase FdhD n=1 Tax=Devosia sp. 63-57 TaxID=1895751 RepID=UPI000868E242|nr:formate dehydrogenase accessory sulfurtransferase FdhD [Devosia sp. 63-57]ODT50983.1 MAG: formate dehydrogenase family accessory protein FdhD [Pelagibacterium sp. SCN 63-126]ODU85519.1 MAG: formate dehydrogenase family accessory protein FdhD [Pelagibacterium sp. SCN 63-17]OJX44358.1 MAG: formate dehydrogenase family accessory protein FdhD [Devosia sp. 63-57]